MTILATFAAFFSFGYCLYDIVSNYRASKHLDEMLKGIEELQKK